MTVYLSYLLIPLMAGLLVSAQAVWGSAIKNQQLLKGSVSEVVGNLITSPRMWLGAILYVVATLVYFLLLSKVKFFSVQVAMTGISVILSTLLAVLFFKESLSAVNLGGMALVLAGVTMVLAR